MSLYETSLKVLKEAVKLKRGERVLIVSNPPESVRLIAFSLYDAAYDLGGKPTLIFQPVKKSFDFAEDCVIAAIESRPDVVISVSQERLGKDKKGIRKPYVCGKRKYDHVFDYLLRGLKAIRGFWTPGITPDIYVRSAPIDYAALKKRCESVARLLRKASSVRILTDKGTDLELFVKGKKVMVDDGDFSKPGRGGNIPAGEVFVSPVLGEGGGTVVIDGSIALEPSRIVREPVEVRIEKGRVVEVKGGELARELESFLKEAEKKPFELERMGRMTEERAKEAAEAARNVGEFGMGLNPSAIISGNVLEDEKVLGTVHVAIGRDFEEQSPALIHVDCVIRQPTVYFDGEKVMDKGRLLIE